MSPSEGVVKRGVLVGVILVSTALGANAMTVARCNVLLDGTYRPALLVEANGESTIHQIGEEGLTRGVVFDEAAALAWAAERYGASFTWNSNPACGPDAALPTVVVADSDDDDDEFIDYLNP